ncbi:hypothetical protein [Bacillus sp. MRMR6]|uniref:hypothetical protein n=1 Tax=Bacillus sp. MRMR6 TaxID=1928617 RepID=UPI00095145C0|nr:hypothetical protein [Bacillus sp. MRMR6]OLS40684.1 hypothetical protein BTR25_07240 [Bacillus sp. MRMR6]
MIRRKIEVAEFLNEFENYANWDGMKYYLTLNTVKPKGNLTIMKYDNGTFTYHRKNELYWDIRENKIECEILTDILWSFRKTINEYIRSKAI